MIKIGNIIEKTIDVEYYLKEIYDMITPSDVIFFDIETTGLNSSKARIYLIGAVYYRGGNWNYIQYFAESYDEEENVIKEFDNLCKEFKYVIHFNGDHFDIPFVTARSALYGIESSLKFLISIDLYHMIKPYKSALALPNCKQKTIEGLLNTNREDKFSGYDLIFQYHDFVRTHSKDLYKNLLLHNEEDLYGMLFLLQILDYLKLFRMLKTGRYELETMDLKEESISFALKFKDVLDFRFNNFKVRDWNVLISENDMTFSSKIYNTVMQHYFIDFQNYYFVPDMDQAIHKSVSKYLEPEKRTKATSANCYIKKEGKFMCMLSSTPDVMTYKKSKNSIESFVLITEYDPGAIKDLLLKDLANIEK